MTDYILALRTPVEKSGDADFLREMIKLATAQIMELEVSAKTGAGLGERSPDRLAQRNGHLCQSPPRSSHRLGRGDHPPRWRYAP